MQNKLIRFVLDLHHRSRISDTYFKSLNWLPVSRRLEEITLIHVFKIKNGLAPGNMKQHSTAPACSLVYKASCSSNGCFAVPKVCSQGSQSFSYMRCSFWNRLPTHIKLMDSLSLFKKRIKRHLLEKL